MRCFRRNVFRCVKKSPGSFLGAVFIIAIGIFVYVSMMDTLRNLGDQVSRYYQSSEMADVFATVAGIPQAELKRLTDIPGIEGVSGKMAADVRFLAPSQNEIVTVHLLSYDPSDSLNQLRLNGEKPEKDSLFLGRRMSEIYGYDDGTSFTLLADGKRITCQMAGTCSAPDYIYAIPPGGAMIPDGEIYDIACIDKNRMEELTGKRDSLNELGFRLEKGYSYEDVRYQLTERLQRFGLVSITSRDKQASYDMVNGELKELYAMGTALPFLFLSISIFMLYVVLKKMIDRDQGLIGTMKAFGMSDRELILSYVFLGAEVGILGSLLGSILAVPFSQAMFGMYIDFFNLPDTVSRIYWNTRLNGLGIAAGTGVLSVLLGVRGILQITPAQAMRAKTPSAGTLIALPSFLAKRLKTMEKMGFRSVVRNPFRGFLIILAVSFPFSMTSVLLSFEGVANQMYFDQFDKVQTYDIQISTDRFISNLKARSAVETIRGVKKSETVVNMAVELKHENLTEFAMVYGLNPGSDMWRIMDLYGTFYEPPDDGIILNTRVAEKLHLKAGDIAEIRVPRITPEPVKVPVKAVIGESLGSGCYMSKEGFYHFFPSVPFTDTILFTVEDGMGSEVRDQLMKTSRVAWLVDTSRIVKSYKNMMGSMLAMTGMFALMSVTAGGILIYNISMINIRERITEFGTLMIMGATDREIGRILFFEQGIYFIAGVLLGLPGSTGIKILLEKLVISDSYTIDLTINSISYLKAFLTCGVMAGISLLAQTRYVKKIRLTDILKERE